LTLRQHAAGKSDHPVCSSISKTSSGTTAPHGTLTATTGELTPNGYRLEVACPRGVTFERWITPCEATIDITMSPALTEGPGHDIAWYSPITFVSGS